jgi:glycosyltransferase involved in cell wall biosynthesis
LSSDIPLITALVCTRNRGGAAAATVASILASDHPNFEVVVVDQSTDDDTAEALAPLCADPRLRCLRSDTRGLGRARNVGLGHARSEVVAMTDDDCEAPADWLSVMAQAFAAHPNVAVAFCNVARAPHDQTAGFIPAYCRAGSVLLSDIRDKRAARGIGAGIAVRRPVVLALGGFDEMLGAGAAFPSCEDGDMAVRALLCGHEVYETDAVAVVHAGFRTWQEGRALSRRDWYGIGAAYAKPLKCGHWRFAAVLASEFGRFALWPPVADLLRGRRPRGLGRIGAFLRGFLRGWLTPVDRRTLLFLPPG